MAAERIRLSIPAGGRESLRVPWADPETGAEMSQLCSLEWSAVVLNELTVDLEVSAQLRPCEPAEASPGLVPLRESSRSRQFRDCFEPSSDDRILALGANSDSGRPAIVDGLVFEFNNAFSWWTEKEVELIALRSPPPGPPPSLVPPLLLLRPLSPIRQSALKGALAQPGPEDDRDSGAVTPGLLRLPDLRVAPGEVDSLLTVEEQVSRFAVHLDACLAEAEARRPIDSPNGDGVWLEDLAQRVAALRSLCQRGPLPPPQELEDPDGSGRGAETAEVAPEPRSSNGLDDDDANMDSAVGDTMYEASGDPCPGPFVDWFHHLFGFMEDDEASVKAQLHIEDGKLHSKANGAAFAIGEFSTPSLGDLREQVKEALADSSSVAAAGLLGAPSVENVVGDVSELHRQSQNRLAAFQVASQFNCLEFVGPSSTPEMGVTRYAEDRTQGPCCAVACGAGTVYRHYFCPQRDAAGDVIREGQSADCQIECLSDFCAELGDDSATNRYFEVRGGYTLAEDRGLRALSERLRALGEEGRDALRARLRLGVQRDVQVTSYSWGRQRVNSSEQLVTQVFGSACSVAYSRNDKDLWEPVAQLVLEASYEATLCASVLSALRHKGIAGSRRVFLTALGGGVFGNSMTWISGAIDRAIKRVCVSNGLALQICLVSYAPPVHGCFENIVQFYSVARFSMDRDEVDSDDGEVSGAASGI